MKYIVENSQEQDGGFCCGATEWGNFGEMTAEEYEHSYYDDDDDGDCFESASNFTELWAKILASKSSQGFMNHIHFVKRKDYTGKLHKEYEWPALRKLVKNHPGVHHMGTFINPNTGNRVDSYCWSFPKEKV